MLIVRVQIAVLAQALRVMGLARVGTGPSFLGATAPMVAVDAHAFSVVLPIGVRAVFDHSFRTGVGSHGVVRPEALGDACRLQFAFALVHGGRQLHISHDELFRCRKDAPLAILLLRGLSLIHI